MKESRDLKRFPETAPMQAAPAMDNRTTTTANPKTASRTKTGIVVAEALDPSVNSFAYTLGAPPAEPIAAEQAATLAAWRELCVAQALMNLTTRFELAQAYGCLSTRDPGSAVAFTATLPGGEAGAHPERLLRISAYNLQRSWVEAEGLEPPAADLLLHAALYAADPRIRWVFQVRSEVLDANAAALKLPSVAPLDADQPTPAWARLTQLLRQQPSRPLVCVVPGRSASVFACAAEAHDAGGLLFVYLARALELGYHQPLP